MKYELNDKIDLSELTRVLLELDDNEKNIFWSAYKKMYDDSEVEIGCELNAYLDPLYVKKLKTIFLSKDH